MAPKIKITRDMILNTAFEIVRMIGHEALNVRSIAEQLNCSTQPVLYQFRSMEEIRNEVYHIANEYHTEYILRDVRNGEDPFLSIGVSYIRFGIEEKNLFRFLFQTNKFEGMDLNSLLSDPDLKPVLEEAGKKLACGSDELKDYFWIFVVAVHGYAALLANNAMEYDPQAAEKTLKILYESVYEKTLRKE